MGPPSSAISNRNPPRKTGTYNGCTSAPGLWPSSPPANGDGRAQVITLALVLGALESRTLKDAWRNATPSWGHHAGSGDYLRWLAANDYPLASVEEVITEAKDAESVYAQYLSDAVKE